MSGMDAKRLYIEYMRLSDIRRYAKNAKDHDIGLLTESILRFGFNEPMTLDEERGILAAGHGRLETLEIARDNDDPLPEHIDIDTDGEWLAPVTRGVSFRDENELRAYIIAANRTTELGGWHSELLLDELKTLAEQSIPLEGTGYDLDDLDQMLRDAEFDTQPAAPAPDAPQPTDDDAHAAEIFGVIVKLGDKSAEDDLIALLEGYDYLARRLSDPVGKFYGIPKASKPAKYDSEESEDDFTDDL